MVKALGYPELEELATTIDHVLGMENMEHVKKVGKRAAATQRRNENAKRTKTHDDRPDAKRAKTNDEQSAPGEKVLVLEEEKRPLTQEVVPDAKVEQVETAGKEKQHTRVETEVEETSMRPTAIAA